MKSFLLASASVFAFAGAAAAEVTFSGEATLGYNDTINAFDDNNYGFYWDGNLAVTFSQELDNGITASASFDFDVADMTTGLDLESGGWVLSLTSPNASLWYGDTTFAAETYWSGVGDMEADGFSEADGEVVLRGEMMFGGVTAGLSYVVADAGGDLVNGTFEDDVDQLSFGATGSFGMFNFTLAYQEESIMALFDDADDDADDDSYDPADENGDFNSNEVIALRVGGTFAGFDVALGYAEQTDAITGVTQDSTGVQIGYTWGPVGITGYYVSENEDNDPDDNYGLTVTYSSGPFDVTLDYDDDQGTTKLGLDGSYDVGNGIVAYAGFYSQDNEDGSDYEDEYYIAAGYDLGGGAAVMVSYAVGEDNEDDEIGALDLQEGATLELTFSF